VAKIWAAVLGLDRVGTSDNFFALGGHSLLAARVVSRIRKELAVELPLRALFESPTVAGLAAQVEAARGERQADSAPPLVAVPRDQGELLPSYSQEALWFLDQLAPGLPTFNSFASVRIKGSLDIEALDWSLREIVRRHEALRTTFLAVEGKPVQIIAPELNIELERINLEDLPKTERAVRAERLAVTEARKPFELARGPLVRAGLFHLEADDHVLWLAMHHIVTDGWSMGVAARELAALYETRRALLPSPLSEPAIQYADFAHWQRSWLQGETFGRLVEYWKRQLDGVPALELFTDRPRPAVRTAEGALREFALPADVSARLIEFGRCAGATPFMTLLAVFQTLLHRLSGQVDFAVGSPVANRNRSETEGLIGFFVNMLAFRADFSGDPTFLEYLARVREVSLGAFEHQDLPLEMVIEALQPRRDPSRSPLFQVMFVLQNNEVPTAGRSELVIEPFFPNEGNGTAKFDLSLALAETAEGLTGSLEYNTHLFDASTIEAMLNQLQNLVEGILAHPGRQISVLPLLSPVERTLVLKDWAECPAIVQDPRCAHELFEAQAARMPEAEALVAGDIRLTYRALNRRANAITRLLRSLRVGPECRVGLAATELPSVVAGLLGVLKAGAAYVPLDTTIPRRRLAQMIADSGLSVLLTERSLQTDLPDGPVPVICLGSLESRDDADNSRATASPLTPAYMIHTSGSTGMPRGVEVSHASLVNAYRAWEVAYDLASGRLRHLQMASFAFDVFTGDWIRALASGGALVACPREVLLDPHRLYALLARERIDCAEFVPAVVEPLVAYLEATNQSLGFMRLIAVGSDHWTVGLHKRLRRVSGPSTRLVNSYGLTEATIDSLYFEGDLSNQPPDRPVPVGRPFAGTRAYVLDRKGQPVGVGMAGEVLIGGDGLALGYFGRPALTAERFLPDAYSGLQGARLYRTGDLGRWRSDGQIELLGRADHQVKIRGFRVELAEVEAALLKHGGVREAVVSLVEEEGGEKFLAAHVVPQRGRTLEVDEVRRALKEILPRHMVPSAFLRLEALPLTASGKVDRQALPKVVRSGASRPGSVRPRDEVEATMSAIWEELLKVSPIGITDDFFDLGGHSLLAVRLLARIEDRFGRRIPLASLIAGATVEELARLVRETQRQSAWSPLVTLRTSGKKPPLFVVHPVGGSVFCYRELARELGPGHSVLGLQAAGLDGDESPVITLEQMAALYISALRTTQAEGPYRLAGWSLGGVVAFEMAQQLKRQGQEVAALILLDSHTPSGPAESPIHETELLASFFLDLARSAGVPVRWPRDRFSTSDPWSLICENSNIREALGEDLNESRLRRLFEVFKANRRALMDYKADVYAGSLTLIRAGNRLVADPTLGWGALAREGVFSHALPGDHYSLLVPPLVTATADLLRRTLDRVSSATEGARS
jgi:amino acid adenylation domain-containing protein